MNLFLIFLTGLTTGGLSCLAMQGGLLASVIANQKKAHANRQFDQMDWLPVVTFLTTKLIAHTLLGAALGLFGSVFSLSIELQLLFQAFAAFFMFATAMNLLDAHPIFRFVVFQPPRYLQRLIRKTSKQDTLFTPAVLGFFTIFIPCGVTQAMEVLAIQSGHPLRGAVIMTAFVLGTSPLFAALGVATARLSEHTYRNVQKIAATLLIGMALYGLNGVLVVLNAPLTLNTLVAPITYFFSDQRITDKLSNGTAGIQITNGVQRLEILVTNAGYAPNYLRVQKDIPVTVTLKSKDAYSCAATFVLNEFGIRTFLQANDTQTFTFTPTKTGKFTYTCSMGMYTGTLEVL